MVVTSLLEKIFKSDAVFVTRFCSCISMLMRFGEALSHPTGNDISCSVQRDRGPSELLQMIDPQRFTCPDLCLLISNR